MRGEKGQVPNMQRELVPPPGLMQEVLMPHVSASTSLCLSSISLYPPTSTFRRLCVRILTPEAIHCRTWCSIVTTTTAEMGHVPLHQAYKYSPGISSISSVSSLSYLSHSQSAIPSVSSMPKTRTKNQSAHPGVPDMTPSQLALAGLSRAQNTPQPKKKKGLTGAKKIKALEEELRIAQEIIARVIDYFTMTLDLV